MNPFDSQSTDDLVKAASGDLEALNRVLPLVQRQVRHIAKRTLTGDRAKQWVQASSLLQRAYLKLLAQRDVDFADEAKVIAVLATIMRRIVIDIARHEAVAQRAHASIAIRLSVSEVSSHYGFQSVDALAIDDSLVALASINHTAARVAELRLWGSLDLAQVAAALDITPRAAAKHWNLAKAWLARDLRSDSR